jgi:hypothetical protein
LLNFEEEQSNIICNICGIHCRSGAKIIEHFAERHPEQMKEVLLTKLKGDLKGMNNGSAMD